MSITPTTMKCPVCEDQTLETLSSSLGTFEQCPNCSGIFISQDLLASASQDRVKYLEALEETRVLRLPTERWCPKCMQKLFEGRVRSRGVILTLCPSCVSFWSDLMILTEFDKVVGKTLHLQIEIATSSRAAESSSLKAASGSTSAGTLYEDSDIGSFFRTFARHLNKWADRMSAEPEAPRKEKVKPAKPQPKKAEKKSIILDVEPEIPAAKPAPAAAPKEMLKEPEPLPQPPKIEIPEFIFPEERVVDPTPAPPPPLPAPVDESADEMRRLMTDSPMRPVKRVEEPKKPKPVLPKPEVKEPLPQPIGESAGFFSKLKSAWSPAPKRSTPSVKPVQPSKPIEPVKPLPKAIEVPQPKPEGGLGKKLAAFFAPKPRPKPIPKPVIKPVEPAKPVEVSKPVEPVPVVEQVKPVEPPKPIEPPKPVAKKPAPAPKPKKVKPPKDPIDHLTVWPPWVLAGLGVACSAFRDFGFEAGPAVLWGIVGWSIGTMIRLTRLYRSPVTLAGQIVLADEQKPKGEVILKLEDKTILLNRLGMWDLIPRLFGLSNPRQLIKGDVTLKGWYRGILMPSFEVDEIRAEKVIRKSMVKTLRWASAIFISIIAIVIYVSLE